MTAEDQIERLVAQWGPERPDLDLGAMATVARLLRLGELFDRIVGELASRYGLRRPEGDILFALRRSGRPFRLSPSQLSEALLVSSGTLTSRLDRLDREGMIERVPNAADRRSVEVQLTERGREAADEAVTVHVADEQRILAALTERERAALDHATSKLIARIESGEWRGGDRGGASKAGPDGARTL